MNLTEMKTSEFIGLLASDAPAPGGGSVAALTAAMGAALTKMVTLLTIGKKKYAEHDGLMKEISGKADEFKAKLAEFIDKDTEAYNGVSAVFSMPKDTGEEKAARQAAMQQALKKAAEVPLDVMSLCLEVLKITEKAVDKSNINAASDLGVAALNLGAGVKGAWLNVLINISGIKDENFAANCREKGSAVLGEAEEISARVYEKILKDVS